jgi:ribonuclease HI
LAPIHPPPVTLSSPSTVYFMSEVLTRFKRFYCEMAKICYAVIMSTRKLRYYFEAHTIRVLTSQPLNDIFRNRENSGRISKWAMKLSVHVVDFENRITIKSQILADFVAQWTEPGSTVEEAVAESQWKVNCDDTWGAAGAGAASILTSPLRIKLRYVERLQFNKEIDKCTNNIVEYEAILLGLRKLRAIGVQRCILRMDSNVVARKIEKECIARGPTLEKYLSLVRRMENFFKGFTVEYIDRNKNSEADELSKPAARNTPLPADVFLQTISDASIRMIESEPRVINIIQREDWQALIMAYLCHYHEPDSTVEQTRMQQIAQSYQIIDNDLYKNSVSGPLLCCASKGEGKQMLSNVHAGLCGGHIRARALATKILWQGFYWPAVIDDAAKLVSKCEACQRFPHKTKAPA